MGAFSRAPNDRVKRGGGRGRSFPSVARLPNDSAIELPDDGLSTQVLVSLLREWRAAPGDSKRRALVPRMVATRLSPLVEAARRRAK